jgi:hypothetical protein
MSTKREGNLPGIDFSTGHTFQTLQLSFGPIPWACSLHLLAVEVRLGTPMIPPIGAKAKPLEIRCP